jgi:hypothetical protein
VSSIPLIISKWSNSFNGYFSMLQPISGCCHYSVGSSAENLTILQLISSINCERMAADNCGDKFRTLRGHCSNHQILLERNCSLTDGDLISLAEDLRMPFHRELCSEVDSLIDSCAIKIVNEFPRVRRACLFS